MCHSSSSALFVAYVTLWVMEINARLHQCSRLFACFLYYVSRRFLAHFYHLLVLLMMFRFLLFVFSCAQSVVGFSFFIGFGGVTYLGDGWF